MSEMFHFKQFSVRQDRCAMKVGTDGVLLGALAGCGQMRNVLDIGTGTGLIALMLAQRFPDARIVGIDIAPDAAAQAADNFAASPWGDRLEVVCTDIREIREQRIENNVQCSMFNPEGVASGSSVVGEAGSDIKEPRERSGNVQYDLIVCNPPFYEHSPAASSAARNQARRTDTLAYGELAECASRLLRDGGVLEVIIPYSAVDGFIHTCWLHDLHLVRRIDIRTKVAKPFKRAVLSFGKELGIRSEELGVRSDKPQISNLKSQCPKVLTLLDADSAPSDEYRALTADFYLDKTI